MVPYLWLLLCDLCHLHSYSQEVSTEPCDWHSFLDGASDFGLLKEGPLCKAAQEGACRIHKDLAGGPANYEREEAAYHC